MSVMPLTAENFDETVASGTTLVDFWAVWCGPCKMQGPVVEAFADKHPEVKVCKVDVDEQPVLASRFEIMSIPTLMVFKNGELVRREVGGKSKEEILEMAGVTETAQA